MVAPTFTAKLDTRYYIARLVPIRRSQMAIRFRGRLGIAGRARCRY
jgi:hypothetical protein